MWTYARRRPRRGTHAAAAARRDVARRSYVWAIRRTFRSGRTFNRRYRCHPPIRDARCLGSARGSVRREIATLMPKRRDTARRPRPLAARDICRRDRRGSEDRRGHAGDAVGAAPVCTRRYATPDISAPLAARFAAREQRPCTRAATYPGDRVRSLRETSAAAIGADQKTGAVTQVTLSAPRRCAPADTRRQISRLRSRLGSPRESSARAQGQRRTQATESARCARYLPPDRRGCQAARSARAHVPPGANRDPQRARRTSHAGGAASERCRPNPAKREHVGRDEPGLSRRLTPTRCGARSAEEWRRPWRPAADIDARSAFGTRRSRRGTHAAAGARHPARRNRAVAALNPIRVDARRLSHAGCGASERADRSRKARARWEGRARLSRRMTSSSLSPSVSGGVAATLAARGRHRRAQRFRHAEIATRHACGGRRASSGAT